MAFRFPLGGGAVGRYKMFNTLAAGAGAGERYT